MKRIIVAGVLATLFLASSSGWSAPTGPGGRIYFTVNAWYRSSDANSPSTVVLYRLDVDTDWSVITDWGAIASLNNAPSTATGSTSRYAGKATMSPEILHARAYDNGTARGGDGSVFLAYHDTIAACKWAKVTSTGSTSVMNTGVTGAVTNNSGGEKLTAYLVDRAGNATGKADTISYWGDGDASWGQGHAFYDNNGNDFLQDVGDTVALAGESRAGDAEVGGSPTNATLSSYIWTSSESKITYKQYTGTLGTPPSASTWANEVTFYNRAAAPTGQRFAVGETNNPGGIAVGDTDGDGRTDVYYVSYLTGVDYDLVTPSVIRVEDGVASVIYDSDTLTGTANDLMATAGADVELIKDPTTAKWTLLIFNRAVTGEEGSASTLTGSIWAMELGADGNFTGSAEGLVVVLSGIPCRVLDTNSAYQRAVPWGIEFDADPAVVPEPGTLLLLGTGVLGAIGYMRRRSMH